MPQDFNGDLLRNLNLRFDLSFFDFQQFKKYKQSISVIKYNLDEYQTNANLVIDFLEEIFPKASFFVNYIVPQNIGDFKVVLLGLNVAHIVNHD